MRYSIRPILLLLLGLALTPASSCLPSPGVGEGGAGRGAGGEGSLAAVAASAAPGAPAAVASLRGMGSAGMEAILALEKADPALSRSPVFHAALDAVCGQHDCAASHLYWYTDLAAARAEARRSGKPILSLRLLGRLDEELSCANSRYFRAVLYPDETISGLLRDRFVLHWESVRPVPKVTVDFGDGRRLVGTVTGNSIHYVLDPNGRIVDALPGLNGPGAFRRFLKRAAAEASRMAALSDADFIHELTAFHAACLGDLKSVLMDDLRQAGAESPEQAAWMTVTTGLWGGIREVRAWRASERAASKSAAELPVLWAVSPDVVHPAPPEVKPSAVADLHFADAKLSAASRRLLLAKAGTWMKLDDEKAAVGRFEGLIAEDTVRNEYLLHSALHTWLAASRQVPDLAAFNEQVYARLFLTPSSDPWLGLAPAELYAVMRPLTP